MTTGLVRRAVHVPRLGGPVDLSVALPEPSRARCVGTHRHHLLLCPACYPRCYSAEHATHKAVR